MQSETSIGTAPNGVELRSGGNALCDDSDVRSDVAYDYVLKEDGVRDNRSCYSFRIGGITLLPTRESDDGPNGMASTESCSSPESAPSMNRRHLLDGVSHASRGPISLRGIAKRLSLVGWN